MTTLLDPGATTALLHRFGTLTPVSPRRWGTMSLCGMLCHLNDAYTGLLRRDEPPPPPAPWPGRHLLRPFALHLPLRWPHGLPTPREVDQRHGGTPPTTFPEDLARTLSSLPRFAAQTDFQGRPHPIFGPLTNWEWMRWAWLHADHHLRQFSA